MTLEVRFCEFRAEGDTLEGVAIRYGDEAVIGPFRERFEAGSVTISPDAIANLQHDRAKPVARIGAGLSFRDGPEDLRAVMNLPDTVYGREARELVKANILRGFSIEFRASDETWQGQTRIIKRALVTGLGIVDIPAYRDSEIATRQAIMDSLTGLPAAQKRYWV